MRDFTSSIAPFFLLQHFYHVKILHTLLLGTGRDCRPVKACKKSKSIAPHILTYLHCLNWSDDGSYFMWNFSLQLKNFYFREELYRKRSFFLSCFLLFDPFQCLFFQCYLQVCYKMITKHETACYQTDQLSNSHPCPSLPRPQWHLKKTVNLCEWIDLIKQRAKTTSRIIAQLTAHKASDSLNGWKK